MNTDAEQGSPLHSHPSHLSPMLVNQYASQQPLMVTNESTILKDNSDTLSILDWEDALTRAANKPDLAAKLILMMLETIADEKEALSQAWQARDRYELAQIAHRILGAVAILAYLNCAKLAKT